MLTICSDLKYKDYIDGNCSIASLVTKNKEILENKIVINLEQEKVQYTKNITHMTHHLFCKHDTTPFSEYKNYKGNPELQTKEAKIKKKKEKILRR